MILKLIKILSIIILFSNVSFAQKEANIWYFGENAGLDFNGGSPVALTDGQLNTVEGCATISDANGNLLFYTDGSTVWDKAHLVMANGSDLNGNWSSTNAALIIPKPLDEDIYYVFTLDERGNSNGLQYSEVDMSLNSGFGDVTSNKNILLETPVTEKITAIKVKDEDAYWVVAHKWRSDEFITYKVTSTGINTTPIISVVGNYMGGFNTNAIGDMKISPDGSKLALAILGQWECMLFDFDNETGVVSNPLTVLSFTTESAFYGVEFSPDSQKLYTSISQKGIFQFNLNGTPSEIINSKTQIGTLSVFNKTLQLAPDGKIYVAQNSSNYLNIISNPNTLGTACNYLSGTNGIFLNGRRSESGLPPFIQSFFNVAFQVDNACFGEITTFNANIPASYDNLLWDFGDGTTSAIETPTHTYTTSGIFEATLEVIISGQTSLYSREIIIYDQPMAHQPQDILVCDDDNDGFYSFDLMSQNLDILNGQNASTFSITYYASMLDYTNNNAIITPSNYINTNAYASQTIVASVKNSNNLVCEDTTTFTIQVFESPTPSLTIPTLSFCDDTSVGTDIDGRIEFDLTQNETTILNGQSTTDFTVNYYTDSGLVNQITNPAIYENTNTSETIYVEVINNSNINCTSQTSFLIEVFELPVVTSLLELKQCDDDLDGFSTFNLTEVNAELSPNYLNETITFYESQIDAENKNNPITNNSSYNNQTVSTDNIWARVENTNECYKIAQVNLIVSTTQIPNTYTRDFYQCDDGLDTTDGIATFNFSAINTQIEVLFPMGQQLIITYYRNLADALSETNAISDIINYQNIGYPNNQDIFIRVDSALDNDCLGLGHHITLHVETVPEANDVMIAKQCDDNGDGMFSFDTSIIETRLLNGQTNVNVEYFDGLGGILPSPLPNPFLTASQTVTARVTNVTSQDPDGSCYDETEIVFTVDAAAVANPVSDFTACDSDNEGKFAFDTTNIEATVLNGQVGMIMSYFDEDGSLLSSPLPNPFTTSTQTITARVENQLSSICYAETTINFIVSEQPVSNAVKNDFVCDDISNDGEYIFTLSNYDTQILNEQSRALFEVFYFDDNTDAQNNIDMLPDSYMVDSNSQTIYARIQNINNANCFDITSFELGVHYLPIANQPEDILVCDDITNDGVELFDLSIQNIDILNGQSAIDNIISYHISLTDAETGSDKRSTDFTNTETSQTIYVRLENAYFPDCYTTTSFEIIVNELPVLLMKEQWPICEGNTVEIIADADYDEYLWSTGEISQSIIVESPGIYEVTATNTYGDLRCETSKTLTVVESNIATITNIETVDWTSNNNNITVYVEGNGNYEYSLDKMNYQDSNEFKNLIIDEYTVYIRDKNGCGIISDSVYLLNYPKFFTPNNDGFNDTWQILNSRHEPNNKVYIYNRYGKLLKELTPTDLGWDGTINANRLASDDYWFVLERQNGKIYKGHFTLKR